MTIPSWLGLRPATRMGTHEFLPVPTRVEIGHSFEHKGSRWRVTWCQPASLGWLIMIVPEK